MVDGLKEVEIMRVHDGRHQRPDVDRNAARAVGITLIGFTRSGSIYSHPGRDA